jgi:hypothetical protein
MADRGTGESPAVDVVIETLVFLSGLPRLFGSRSGYGTLGGSRQRHAYPKMKTALCILAVPGWLSGKVWARVTSVAICAGGICYREVCFIAVPFSSFHYRLTERSQYVDPTGHVMIDVGDVVSISCFHCEPRSTFDRSSLSSQTLGA